MDSITLLTIVGLLLVSMPFFIFWLWVLADCAKNEPYTNSNRIQWLLFIVMFGPIAGLVYIIFRRPNRPQKTREETESIFVPRPPTD